MYFLDKIIKNNEKLIKWDSRISCTENILNSMFTEDIQEFIKKQDSYPVYYNCFLNDIFITKIGYCFQEKKSFIKCEFELVNLFETASFFEYNDFQNCTFYISNKQHLDNVFRLSPFIRDIFNNHCNKVIFKPYIAHLSNKYSKNLNKIPQHLLNGVSLSYADLSDCILPKDENFFKNLSSNSIACCKFANVDFTNYNLQNTTFKDCVFSSNCTISKDMMFSKLFNCTLPIINFNNYKLDYSPNISFIGCSFADGTIFPKDEDFFINCSVEFATLPVYDYSNFKVNMKKNQNIFSNCTFKEGSKLPKDFFKSENISILKKLKEVPSEYLDCYIRYNLITDPYKFLELHHHKLSDISFIILCNKYNLTF